MGTQERKQRQFAEREQRFLDAARAQICEQGLLSLQMAPVARACDYATGTLYQHFASKEDLLCAICAEMAEKRVEKFRNVVKWGASTRERMFGFAVADMLFARENPEHFRLHQYVLTEVVWQAASPRRREQLLEANRPLGDMVGTVIAEAVACGDLDNRGRAPLELGIGQWCLVTGMHNLVHAQGVLEIYNLNEPYRLMLQQLNALLNGLGWQPTADSFDDAALQRTVDRIRTELFPELCPQDPAGTAH
ncbi:MAG: TetR/AcrR family transcriptional regulator [Alcanivoracaceae bacterium]